MNNYDQYRAFVRSLTDEQLDLFYAAFRYEDWYHNRDSRDLYDTLQYALETRKHAPLHLNVKIGDKVRIAHWDEYVAFYRTGKSANAPLFLTQDDPLEIVSCDENHAYVRASNQWNTNARIPYAYLEKL